MDFILLGTPYMTEKIGKHSVGSHKDINIIQKSSFNTSTNPNNLWKTPHSNSITLGGKI
jgi:hypothetical protein